MNHACYWLLDSVIENPFPVHWLNPSYEDLSMAFNRKHHGLSLSEVEESFSELCEKRYLGVYIGRHFSEYDQTPLFPSMLEIRSALRGETMMHYVVTPEGGKQWEALSPPEWQKYSVTGGTPMCIVAGDKAILEELLLLESYIAPSYEIVSESVRKSTIKPWRATYWKTVAVGYSACFETVKNVSTTKDTSMEAYNRWSEILNWYEQPDV
ncbi:MAG: hypothetical protein H7Z42_19955 [Roseiflexaceae bacterium]|nr:hypothetical protein [Roseiflexaceae bacterium]